MLLIKFENLEQSILSNPLKIDDKFCLHNMIMVSHFPASLLVERLTYAWLDCEIELTEAHLNIKRTVNLNFEKCIRDLVVTCIYVLVLNTAVLPAPNNL